MRDKIQKSMIFILAITIIISYGFVSFFVYSQSLSILEADVCQEAKYIEKAIEITGTQYLEELDGVDARTRITRIAQDGKVLYDSRGDESTLDNHKDRVEVREALKNGTGEDIRMSDTVGKELYYYAVLLDDGTVLRVARNMNSLISTAIQIFPAMAVIAAIVLAFVYILGRWQTARLIRPINELDIEHPLDNEIYEELDPLLEAIDKQNKEKDAVANMRKEFSANVSHELKTPLTSISGYAEIMKNGLVKPEDIQKFSERIYKEARRLITLVEDIIKLSKLDEESVELEKEEVNLYDMTREIVSRLSMQSSAKHVRVILEGESVTYTGIRQILDEMIYNICENAIKYNRPGGSVRVELAQGQEKCIIRVSDTGCGIPEEYQRSIFQPFFRIDKSRSREYGGAGLGLSLVWEIANLHGGSVWVEKSSDKGTTIAVELPTQQSTKP